MQELPARTVSGRKPRSYPRLSTVMAFSIALICLVVFGIVTVRFVGGLQVNVVQAEAGVLEELLPAEFLTMRAETAVAAPFSGSLEWVAEEGERVAKGALLGYLSVVRGSSLEKTEKIALTAPRAGVLSFRVDGYEQLCDPGKWGEIALDKVLAPNDQSEAPPPGNAEKKTRVEAGTLIYKIVDNLEPVYLYAETAEPLAEALMKEKGLGLRLDNMENPIRAKIAGVIQPGDRTQVLLMLYEKQGFENTRRLQGRIIIEEYKGIVLSEQDLVTKEGSEGVYVFNSGKACWKAVNPVARNGGRVVVTGIEPGEWIVTSPQTVKEGQRIYFRRR